jgi:hypothetical protein
VSVSVIPIEGVIGFLRAKPYLDPRQQSEIDKLAEQRAKFEAKFEQWKRDPLWKADLTFLPSPRRKSLDGQIEREELPV